MTTVITSPQRFHPRPPSNKSGPQHLRSLVNGVFLIKGWGVFIIRGKVASLNFEDPEVENPEALLDHS